MCARLAVGLLLGVVGAAFPPPAHAAWVNSSKTQFQVGGQLPGTPITPTLPSPNPSLFVDPTCGNQGGTSLAIVQGSKLAGVDPILYPSALVVSCLDNSNVATQARLNFLNPADGKVVKQISTLTTPSGGWAHLVHRPDKGDLLGCGNNGTIYKIDFSQFTSIADGTATAVPRPSGLPTNCAALGWDPEEDMIYQGVTGGNNVVGVHRFLEGATTDDAFFNLTQCTPSGVAITGGVLLVACKGGTTILRLDKSTGTTLGINGTLGATGLTPLNPEPGLGDLACDPVTFQKDTSGKDLFRDAFWSRRGANGNGVVALEFPAFTCGLPSNSVVVDPILGPLSPLAAGLSAPAVLGGPAGAVPLAACFDTSGKVIDLDGDGLPDCWEGPTKGIDFDGDGVIDLVLCVQVDTNGDGVPEATPECADPTHKDLFVEIDWMQDHKPDPLALSQPATVASVQSVRAAFAAAPVFGNPDAASGVRIHFQVDEQVTFTALDGTPSKSHVSQLAFTPCTGPASNAISPSDAADFDAIKKLNFGTVAERASIKTLNAKRLAFRYVLFAHNQVGSSPGGTSTASGCSEVGGDDAAITLGSFTSTTVSGLTHNRGTTDQQAGTFMHEFGHLLGLRHGGGDNVNCKPNYLSVMSYTRQIAGSPIPGRRLDYSRAALPSLGLDESNLLETAGLCPSCDAATLATLAPLSPFFPSADQTAFGPSVWSVVAANSSTINWSRDKTKQGLPIIETSPVSANINQGSGGCDGSDTLLKGHDDWSNLLYRASAAIDFAGGFHSATAQEHTSLTSEQVEDLFLAADLDANGVGDAQDCGTFPDGTTFFCPLHQCGTNPDGTPRLCPTHRIDIKPSFSLPKTVNLGSEATITIAIFSEVSPNTPQVLGNGLWDAVFEVVKDANLTFSVESLVVPVKINKNGQGTCSARDVDDPTTGLTDGRKDLLCQFSTRGLPLGKHEGVVSGKFLDPNTQEIRFFRAKQEFTVVQ